MKLGSGSFRFLVAVLLWAGLPLSAGATQASAKFTVTAANGAARANRDFTVVIWLAPLAYPGGVRPITPNDLPHARLVQKNKVFDPHVLAVQVGSEVDFPNRDPFFHNVFSLFNGKRFDLGLYEAGSTRGVHFDRAGICYIFCNIHPQMSAVIVVVDTPYFAVSELRGEITIPHVPAGRYQMNIWEEHCSAQALKDLSRQVTVGDEPTSLGSIHLQESEEPVKAHLNKYGKSYDPEVFSSPLYVQP